ncbi:MAG: hypothetical protein HOG58_00455 [Euryarchaeota archaeon]|mgnify:CR=1 FL=1|jgi:hypothetical protein|nr:hypothetical protein [Euryarchaeota archaeon]MBT6072655.1 hypothetical protein [Euryarchaeota archaeon]MBT6075083.1 hypothetical protein [Euryarchaeota archaeon]MBT6559800.1 hypothetical protein [Euryarchaeota archaeon]MBT6775260.1 hypothetical protein [Euryarchaeota archaeon]
MRRKQTALLMTVLILSSLAFVSQTRPQAPVENTNPGEAAGGGPPVTDEDGDRIPDFHEAVLFGEDIILDTGSEILRISGLDSKNGTDNMSDHDNDGASALLEYCWPYTLDKCFTDRIALTGKPGELSESGIREWLDPRVADTDGDGLPDGYEIYMCTEGGLGYLNTTSAWTCLWFDPLDPSDMWEDIDRCVDFTFGCGDGFDVDRNGVIDATEIYSNSEEYIFGAPEDWITERDGLWCSGEINLLTIGSCQTTVERETGDGWLGSDPTESDSDYYSWSEIISVGLAIPGDGIPDGWEVHYGLDPRNASDSILDSDSDGWDLDRDGYIIPDTSVATTSWGESFSNYEEYMIHYDGGVSVTPGLRSIDMSNLDSEFLTFDQSTSPQLIDSAVHTIIPDNERDRLIIGSKYGITILDPFNDLSTIQNLPAGMQLNSMIMWSKNGDDYLVMLTNSGITVVEMENGIPQFDLSSFGDSDFSYSIDSLTEIAVLNTGSGNLDVMLFSGQNAWTTSISGPSMTPPVYLESISDLLSNNAADVNTALHMDVDGRGPLLLIGTNGGLIAWNTTDGSDSVGEPWWVFNRENAENYVQKADLLNISKSAIVNVLELAGPKDSAGNYELITGAWIGTAGGLHLIDIEEIISMPLSAFDSERMWKEENWLSGSNDVHSVYTSNNNLVIVGSRDGTWVLEGGYQGVTGLSDNQTYLPGLVTSMATIESSSAVYLFAGISPGKYMNIMPINPQSSDSDLDGMPDGWEFIHGLDPTDPYDRDRDADADGVFYNPDIGEGIDRSWTNLDEYRFITSSDNGFNGTDPRETDTDGDGLTDGEEYWGWFTESTNFDCHYLNDEYICDEDTGILSQSVHLEGWLGSGAGGGTDGPTDPTNIDSDGDGMPDGWEIENRRWIGDIYNGGNLWTLDPRDPTDANDDADNDGLSNLCEYKWSNLLETVIEEGLPSHGETSDAALNWTATDPNNIDSDGDSLPDGWEARYSCSWSVNAAGLNPLNGSDALNNPDGDGYDVNHNGVLELEEQLVNWIEFHWKSDIIFSDTTDNGLVFPENFTTVLFNDTWENFAEGSFGEYATNSYNSLINATTAIDIGSGNPLNPDSDQDGMPDGWEFFHARWSLFEGTWTLNPVNEQDRTGDPDGDGMNNWEEYNVISSNLSEIDSLITVPQFYLLYFGGEYLPNPWLSAESASSFGSFLSSEQINLTGLTADPNNPDTDSDGLLDGMELIFTKWNSTDNVWTLNPLVPNDGNYDSDNDGISDQIELNLTLNNPMNGGLSPPDAPRLWEEAEYLDPSEAENRVYRILFNKEGRAQIALQQFQDWQGGSTAKPLLQALFGISDPTSVDTDRDGMSDGYEYWFTEWNLEDNRWEMNLLTGTDINVDTDQDSFDCNGDGIISPSETFDNLAEFESRIYGKKLAIDSIPNGTGLVSYGADAVNAYIDEESMSYSAAFSQLYVTFTTKSLLSSEKSGLINEINPDNFNISLAGISDPTDSDSDRDGMPDGWEYCYSVYGEFLPVNDYRWSMNPINPLDINYDPDADGWYDRQFNDQPATQGKWENRQFTPLATENQISNGVLGLYFSNLMEYNNGTHPLDADSDDDSMIMEPVITNGEVTSYVQNMNLTDGREVFKYGTNPLDNDTDGDMMPDFYEYYRGWNETNDNWSSYLQIQVQWEQISSNNWKPVQIINGVIARPVLNSVWFTHDATNADDAGQDADMDGGWDCSGGNCLYESYNNFQEYYGVVNASLSSPSLVRQAMLNDCSGNYVEEWWQLRESLLGTCSGSSALDSNYFRMYKINNNDQLFALIIDDNDLDYQYLDTSDDETLCSGEWTDSYGRFAGDQYHLPNTGLGEYVFSWWLLDIDGDQIADGTDPTNWDTDGDWLNDYFEIEDDMLDGIRGNSASPIRYDDRTTS